MAFIFPKEDEASWDSTHKYSAIWKRSINQDKIFGGDDNDEYSGSKDENGHVDDFSEVMLNSQRRYMSHPHIVSRNLHSQINSSNSHGRNRLTNRKTAHSNNYGLKKQYSPSSRLVSISCLKQDWHVNRCNDIRD